MSVCVRKDNITDGPDALYSTTPLPAHLNLTRTIAWSKLTRTTEQATLHRAAPGSRESK